jgi:RHS repeat-associated protein
MGFYATDILESAPPSRTDPVRARQHSLCGQKPSRGPIHNAISGYRYNNPELGRWINRDPIGEEGGLNVYSFLNNASLRQIDYLGLTSLTDVERGFAGYTWHLGWVDMKHARESSALAREWERLENAPIGSNIVVRLQNKQDIFVKVNNLYCITVSENRVGQLLWAYQDMQMEFEELQNNIFQRYEWQNKLIGRLLKNEKDKMPSSFSSEDLVSNLISFYASIDGIKAIDLINAHGGPMGGDLKSNDSIEFSVFVWKHVHKVRPGYKEWEPDYIPDDLIDRIENGPRRIGGPGALRQFQMIEYINRMRNEHGTSRFPEYFRRYIPDKVGVERLDR